MTSSIITAAAASSTSPSSPTPPTSTSSASTRRLASDGLPPLRVVVTGGSKGIGRALVEEFLSAGDDVAFCSRDAARVAEAERELREKFSLPSTSPPSSSAQSLFAAPCDVSKPGEARAFASKAAEALGAGRIDVWINNAGMSSWGSLAAADVAADSKNDNSSSSSSGNGIGGSNSSGDYFCDEEEIAAVISTNVTGSILGTRAAILQFLNQEGSVGGHCFNMDGAGSEGGATPFFAAYGASKCALTQLHKSVKAEIKELGLEGKVGIHRISPGMVTTDLLMKGTARPKAKFFVNALAEKPEDSARFLVPRIREIARQPGSPMRSGPNAPSAAFLTPVKAFSQLAARVLTGARKDRFLVEE